MRKARTFRAPAIGWTLAAAVLCTAFASLERTAPAQDSQAAARSPQPADFCLTVKLFDFNERPLGNYEDTPMYWRRLTGDGLPAYSGGRFDEQVGHSAPPAFLFTLRGGNIGYEYEHDNLVVSPDSDYLVEGYIRAEGLENAAALVVCYLVAPSGQRLAGSEQVSQPVRSKAAARGGDTEEWQRIEIPLHVDVSDACVLRLQLWALQNYVFEEADETDSDPITRQDVDARVWFDDLALVRLPRARLSFSTPGGLVQPGGRGAFEVALHNPAPAGLRANFTVVDDGGQERFRTASELPPESTEEFTVDLPTLPPGTYVANLALTAGDAEAAAESTALIRRSSRFAVLPELPGGLAPRPDKGIDLGCWAGKDPQGAEALAAGLGCGTVKIGLPMTGAPRDKRAAEYLRQARDLAQALELRQIEPVGVALPPPGAEGSRSPHTVYRSLAGSDGWEEQLGPLLAYFGGHLPWWQLGDEAAELCSAVDWNPVVGQVHQRLKRFLATPLLAAPRSIFDAIPAAELLAPVVADSDSPAPSAVSAKQETADATTFWVPATIAASAIPWHLAFLFAGEASDTPAALSERGRLPWLSLEVDRNPGLTRVERLTDLARRFVLASAANPARVYVPAPFALTSAGGAAAWQPTDEYIPLRTLIRHLSGLRARAALALPGDAVAILFGEGQRHTLVLWTWQQEAGGVTADLYVGGQASATELSGAPRTLEFDGARARIPLTGAPLIVTDVDAPLLLFQDGVQIAPTFIELRNAAAPPVLTLRNPYPVEVSGTVELHAPAGWGVSPNPVPVRLGPGQTLVQALTLGIPPRQVAGPREIEIDVRLSQPESVALHFAVPLELGLRDVALEASAWWDGEDLLVEQRLRNVSAGPVSFNAFCQPPEHAQLEGIFLDVPPGEVRRHTYRLPAARALAGMQLWMGIAEIGGPRTLDQLVSIPR